MERVKKGFYQVATMLMCLVVFGLIGGFGTVTFMRVSVFCMLLFFSVWMLDFAKERGWIGRKKRDDQ